jgi:hypothetical protein
LLFGDVRGVNIFDSGVMKVLFVEESIFDAHLSQCFRKLRLPDSFRQPEAAGLCPEIFLQKLVHHPDLANTVLLRNDRKNRLVEAPTKEFDLTAANHVLDRFPAIFLFGLHVLPKGPGKVERKFNRRMLDHILKERQIAILKGSLEDEGEISHGLVIMDGKKEYELIHR